MMRFELTPYELAGPAAAALLALAEESDVLLIGETHGTQEVPRLMLGLLDPLAARGYGGLALELPADIREETVRWAGGAAPEPSLFFTRPGADGRGNEQALALIQQAVVRGWQLLCFDRAKHQPTEGWAERDASMARNLLEQWKWLCPGKKLLGACGNLHSRLAPLPGEMARFWPSCAHMVRQLRPEARVGSAIVCFHSGEFFNQGKVMGFFDLGPLSGAEVRGGKESQHSLELHLPRATVATFLSPPNGRTGE